MVEFGAIGAIGFGATIVFGHGGHLLETTDRGAFGAQTPTTDSGKVGIQTPRLVTPTRCAFGGTILTIEYNLTRVCTGRPF